ncbi:arginase family protein [Acetobacter farinalis]|uniref:Arginase family protein n=1 Tax=Acetobacter farinalis TaxID=1260984 RepID=A0ABT3Q6H7_9PROT|nr:arginase family protein [Acetobacter farinalis]NHO29534.1 arginase family protein [Acetobacter farinalis]
MESILAPTNLGLSPLYQGHEPGVWRAPDVLMSAGLEEALGPDVSITRLPRPAYHPEPPEGTCIRNGYAIRQFSVMLAGHVAHSVQQGHFVLVLGGDCSILLGALAGARQKGPVFLIHFDGHSDFRHPGNYDARRVKSGVAGMDLALATGRGEAFLTQWPGVSGPLVPDERVFQIGERESHDPDFAWPDITATAITQNDIFEFQRIGRAGTSLRIKTFLDAQTETAFWIHFDVDVLDQAFMPAVDCPGSPGLSPADMHAFLTPLVSDRRCLGMTVSIYDPEKDPTGRCAQTLVTLLGHLAYRGGRVPGKSPDSSAREGA